MTKKYDYDAIIIGAGIGGLICGCYLAKAGLKTLIIEKNANPGGCCTSFIRAGFRFDACVHFLGSLRKNGIMKKVMHEIGVQNDIKILRHDPSDIIISDDYKFSFWQNVDRTIKELQQYFPHEKKSIESFFRYIEKIEGHDFLEFRNKTLQDILARHFNDARLKALLGFPILGNAGLPPSRVSAIKAMTLYKEFMLDGGYYITNGAQALPSALARKFLKYGGSILYNAPVQKIIVQNGKAKGIISKQGELFTANYIISNADAYHTFFDLVGPKCTSKALQTTLANLEPSLSMFALYLGIKDSPFNFPPHANVWYLGGYNLDILYRYVLNGNIKEIKWFLGYYNPDEKTILCFFNVPYISKTYWSKNKNRVAELLLNKIDKVLPRTSSSICYQDAATPDTMFRRTSNYKGAAYGWAGTVDQFSLTGLSQVTHIKNLFLTGHWATLVQGISGVAYLGMITAQTILRINEIRS